MSSSSDRENPLLQAASFLPPSLEELNQLIPAYEFLDFIDRGGMGVVYKARQRSLDRIVAVKLLPVMMSNRKAFSDRFKREARALALLNHPNIVSVYDFGEAIGGCLYYVMEYVKGTTLRQIMKEGRTTSRRLLSIAMQVCEALQFAHLHGVVHRDVKPANILLDERGTVKVADFGLAKVIGTGAGRELTAHSDSLGTPDYMAPEAVTNHHELDHRADIYSLGVMLYEVLTGRVPRGAWEPPSRTMGIDPRFDDLVGRALQTDPQKRFQTVGEITRIMKQLVQASGTQTGISSPALDRVPPALDPSATTVAMRPQGSARGFPRLAVAALCAAFVGGIGFSYLKDLPPVQRLLGARPIKEVPNPLTHQERQRALARFVAAHGGFFNIVTPSQHQRVMGPMGDLYSLTELPKGDFTVWRVSMDDVTFTDEDFAALMHLCEQAGSVTNVNLHGSGVTSRGIALITKLSDTLESLKLTETKAFTPDSLPFLATCKNLRLLLVSQSGPEATRATLQAEIELVRRLREFLPDCDIRQD